MIETWTCFILCHSCNDYIIDKMLWCENDKCCINCCPRANDGEDDEADMDDRED